MNIEHALTKRVPAASKLHTARSRNDQVATDMRLFFKHACPAWGEGAGVQRAFLGVAGKNRDVLMPGYTHLQRAQPVYAAHHLFGVDGDARARPRPVGRGRPEGQRCPLGSGAIAGPRCPSTGNSRRARSASSIPRAAARHAEFDGRGGGPGRLHRVCGGLRTSGVHLSRIAEDLVLWCSAEFRFVALPDAFCTGCSLMPQKTNPDSCELLRGKSARLQGNLHTLLTLVKGLPMTYNRDLQEDKPPVFDSFDQSTICAEVLGPPWRGA